MDQRVSLITFGVADLDRARRFYEDGLGWTKANKEPGIAFYQLPGMVLGIWPREQLVEDSGIVDDGGLFGGVTVALNVRSREEVDRSLEQAKAAGATITKAAADTFWGGYSGYFADPDYHLWEVAWNPFWTLDEEGRVSLD